MKFSLNTPKLSSSPQALVGEGCREACLIQRHREKAEKRVVYMYFFFPHPREKKPFKGGPGLIVRHNEPSLADIREFIHKVAQDVVSVQDVILMPQHDK